MKKLFVGIFAASMMFGFSSCKKDYTCDCSGASGLPDAEYTYEDVKKADAETACDAWDTQYAASGGSCSIK